MSFESKEDKIWGKGNPKIAQRNQNDWWMKDVGMIESSFLTLWVMFFFTLIHDLALESWLVDQGIHFNVAIA
jgi:hypothetical protein